MRPHSLDMYLALASGNHPVIALFRLPSLGCLIGIAEKLLGELCSFFPKLDGSLWAEAILRHHQEANVISSGFMCPAAGLIDYQVGEDRDGPIRYLTNSIKGIIKGQGLNCGERPGCVMRRVVRNHVPQH